MCLRVAIERPDAIVESGVLHHHEYHIIHNGMGHLCGYIKLDPGHPWHGKDYMDLPARCHGGLTFGEVDIPCDKGGPDSGYWVGFDCGHGGDLPDIKYVAEEHMEYYEIMTKRPMYQAWGKVRDVDYVRGQCELLAIQANVAEIFPEISPDLVVA